MPYNTSLLHVATQSLEMVQRIMCATGGVRAHHVSKTGRCSDLYLIESAHPLDLCWMSASQFDKGTSCSRRRMHRMSPLAHPGTIPSPFMPCCTPVQGAWTCKCEGLEYPRCPFGSFGTNPSNRSPTAFKIHVDSRALVPSVSMCSPAAQSARLAGSDATQNPGILCFSVCRLGIIS